MRFIRIVLLHFENVMEYRSRVFVWFLFSLLGPILYLLFWKGVSNSVWDYTSIATYYILFILAGTLLMTHIEEDIIEYDIYRGELLRYLTRPLSYLFAKFAMEFPYRVFQSFFSVVTLIIVLLKFSNLFIIPVKLETLGFGMIAALLGFFVGFFMKMSFGLLAFWFTDMRGISEFFDIVLILFAGGTIPLILLPGNLYTYSMFSPFPYIMYVPVMIIMGKLTGTMLIQTLLAQCIWIVFFLGTYSVLWKRGVKKFTGVGD